MKDRLRAKAWKKIFHVNEMGKKASVTILIFDKIHFKTKTILRDKEEHYMRVNEKIH